MIRLVFSVTNDLSYDQRMQRICRTLSRAGYHVTLVGFNRPNSRELSNEPYEQIRLDLRITRGKLFYLEYNFRLFQFFLKRPIDVLISIDLDTLSAGYLASQRKKIPLVLDAHEFYSELPEVVSRPLIRTFWGQLERWLCPRVSFNYTVSYSIAQAMHERYHQNYEVFPNYPNRTQRVALSDSAAKSFVLYQGALNQGRGLEQAIRAFEGLDIQLHIAGEGDLSEPLRDLASSSPAADKIKFLGYLEPDNLRRYTQKAWLGINLLENRGLSYYYSLSNKFFDYLHAGIPQISMDFPEYRRINDQLEVAILLPEPDPVLIRKAIESLQNDPERYTRMQANCLLAQERFCWEAIEPDLLSFYQHLVDSAVQSPSQPLAHSSSNKEISS